MTQKRLEILAGMLEGCPVDRVDPLATEFDCLQDPCKAHNLPLKQRRVQEMQCWLAWAEAEERKDGTV